MVVISFKLFGFWFSNKCEIYFWKMIFKYFELILIFIVFLIVFFLEENCNNISGNVVRIKGIYYYVVNVFFNSIRFLCYLVYLKKFLIFYFYFLLSF